MSVLDAIDWNKVVNRRKISGTKLVWEQARNGIITLKLGFTDLAFWQPGIPYGFLQHQTRPYEARAYHTLRGWLDGLRQYHYKWPPQAWINVAIRITARGTLSKRRK